MISDIWLASTSTFLDQSKAFDLANFEMLVAKLSCLGFADTEIWFQSYLAERSQRVVLMSDAQKCGASPFRYISSGVPQGNVLRPLVFAIYVFDLSQSNEKCSVHLNADDI